MLNAKQELLQHVQHVENLTGFSSGLTVELVKIAYKKEGQIVRIEGTLDDVVEHLDFTYHDGHGLQNLFGCVWYVDGTWSEREEYDGSDCWQHRNRPSKAAELSL